MSGNMTYLPCKKGGDHQGQVLNIICLNQYCYSAPLCCCSCIQQFHQGHKTKTLKKIIAEAEQALNNGISPSSSTTNWSFDPNIILNVILYNESLTLNKFKTLRYSINMTLDAIQHNLFTYFNEMKAGIQKSNTKSDPIGVIKSCLSQISQNSQYNKVTLAVQKLILQLNKIDQEGRIKIVENSQQSIINMVNQSIIEVSELIDQRFSQLRNVLSQSSNYLFQSTTSINKIWDQPLFQFSSQLRASTIQVSNPHSVASTKNGAYQMALMKPQISLKGPIQVFRFKIKKLTNNWIAVGVAHKNIIQNKGFQFQFNKTGHGAYMISANAGTWHHTVPELNNKVKAFKFQEGDTITCIVDNQSNSIYFVREVQISQITFDQREVYQLPFNPVYGDPIHPCVTLFYGDNEVQYIPATNVSQIPRYQYLFTQVGKGPQISILNGNKMIRNDSRKSGYKKCILNRSVQDGHYNTSKRFSFRIVHSSNQWIGVGICHIKGSQNNAFQKNQYQQLGHGFYMISANGGSWSSIDSSLNNIVKAFKFKTGDTIQCNVEFGEGPESSFNRIIFKRGRDKYIIKFKCIPGDKLYPCVMLYYTGDQVNVLPNF